ncbi:MAG: hypothetical protein HYU88_12810 [Chloroflexi bacterium]|nr:hypothetical protein [Chloroflexota bacterium]MBI4507324.1 hypothetical protein [Chloroflexota bacterium]
MEHSVRSGWPPCRQCNAGELVPLSDFGSGGTAIHFKAWVCTNPACGFNLKIRGGDVYRNEPVVDAAGEGRFARRGGSPPGGRVV